MDYSVGILTITVFFLVFDFFSEDEVLSRKGFLIASVSFLTLNFVVLWFANNFFFKADFLEIWIISMKTSALIFLICCSYLLIRRFVKS